MGKKKKNNRKQIEVVQKLPSKLLQVDEGIIYNILLHVPPELLHSKFRLVCKSWFSLISWPVFIEKQLAYGKSKPSLVVGLPSRYSWIAHQLELKESVLDVPSNTNLLESLDGSMGEIRASCNGLLLAVDRKNEYQLQVWNHVTKRMKLLPKCPSGCAHKNCACGLAYDPLKDQYKVVHMYADQFGYEIMTLRSGDGGSNNSWRRIPGPFKSMYDRPFGPMDFYWEDPILVKSSVLHWPVNTQKYIISMNVSDEVPRKTPLPTCRRCAASKLTNVLVDMGGFLALLSHVNGNLMEFWVLKDYDAGIWVKELSISIDNIILINCRPQLNKLEPLACLEDGAVVVFGHKGSNPGLYLYDVRRSRMMKYKRRLKDEYKCFVLQKSLASWGTSSDPRCALPIRCSVPKKVETNMFTSLMGDGMGQTHGAILENSPRERDGEVGFTVFNFHEDMSKLEID